jgi:hypothetical protein
MIEVRILHLGADEIMTLVRELRSRGLVQGVDFDFAYNRACYINDGWTAVIPRHTLFSFYKESEATLFALKYGF